MLGVASFMSSSRRGSKSREINSLFRSHKCLRLKGKSLFFFLEDFKSLASANSATPASGSLSFTIDKSPGFLKPSAAVLQNSRPKGVLKTSFSGPKTAFSGLFSGFFRGYHIYYVRLDLVRPQSGKRAWWRLPVGPKKPDSRLTSRGLPYNTHFKMKTGSGPAGPRRLSTQTETQ